jgi:hypothetical protein
VKNLLLLIGGLVLFLAAGFIVLRDRDPSSPAELVAYLPDKEGTLLYANVDAMRKAGILTMLAGSKATDDADYKDFLQQTGFDYRHDLDAVAATMRSGQVFFALRGRFDWDKLTAYAKKRGGSCKESYCVTDGSQPSRRISFHKLRSNLMAMAVSPDDMAAYQVARNASHLNPFSPDAPVWVMVPAAVLKEANSLPAGTQAFALALEKADRAIFSIGPDGDHLKVMVNVTCKNAEAASNLLVQLERTTNQLRHMLAQENRTANPQDLSGVLVAGTFRRDDRKVYGEWPLQRAFVESITASP